MNKMPKKLVLNDFCMRQFSKDKPSSCMINMDPQVFIEKLNELYFQNPILKDGYAPFCKHVFIENFTDCQSYYLPINEQNKNLLETEYQARAEYELPVLRRFFPKQKVTSQKANKEQIDKEEEKIDKNRQKNNQDYDWGVISVKAQDINEEIKMDPITMMRNALGMEEGGSGVKLNREEYQKSVDFWSKNAIIIQNN